MGNTAYRSKNMEETVTVENDIVYDVSLIVEEVPGYGKFLFMEATYNEDLTAENYDSIAEVHETEPVTERYCAIVPFLGSLSSEDDIERYFELLRDIPEEELVQ